MKKLYTFLLIFLLLPAVSTAAMFKTGDEISVNTATPLVDNLYAAAGNITINSDIKGDLWSAGGNTLITGTVTDDLLSIGGTVTILGDVDGDARVAGGNVLVSGEITGDLIVAGGSVIVSADSSVGRDIVIAGGQVSLDGSVAGDVRMFAGSATIAGQVGGSVEVEVDQSLTLGPAAQIDGPLSYYALSAEVLDQDPSAVVSGGVTYSERTAMMMDPKQAIGYLIAGAIIFVLIKLCAILLAALGLYWINKDAADDIANSAISRPWANMGRGLVVLIVVPIVSILAMATLVGMLVGLVALAAYVLLVLLAAIYTGIIAGAWLAKLWSKTAKAHVGWKSVVGGTIFVLFLKFVPLLGGLVVFLLLLISLGVLVDMLYRRICD